MFIRNDFYNNLIISKLILDTRKQIKVKHWNMNMYIVY